MDETSFRYSMWMLDVFILSDAFRERKVPIVNNEKTGGNPGNPLQTAGKRAIIQKESKINKQKSKKICSGCGSAVTAGFRQRQS